MRTQPRYGSHRRTARLVLPLLAAVSLATALSVDTARAATLSIGIQGEPASLDTARIGGTTWENDVLGDLFEGLVTLDPAGEYIPGAASGWDISDDGTVYTFKLRDDANWSDGEPVVAKDFVLAFQRLFDPANGAVYASLFYPIRGAEAHTKGEQDAPELGVEAVDAKTLKITLNQPTPYFPTLLAHIAASPVPSHLVDRFGNDWTQMDHIATNGAFTPTSWTSHDHIAARKNPEFHDADDVALDGVDYYPVEDRSAGLQRFRAGGLDIVRDFSPDRYQWLQENLPGAVHLAPQLANYYFALNQRDGHPTADKRVREALNLAIRRDVIADKIMGGVVSPAGGFVPGGVSHYDAQTMPGLDRTMDERVAEARSLLADAGYGPDHPLELTLRYSTTEANKRIAVALAAMWQPLGVETQLINAEGAVHYAELANGNFDVGRGSWVADFDDASNFLGILQSDSPKNYGGYRSQAFDELMARASRETDIAARQQLLQQAERQALSDYAVAPIYVDVSRNLVNPGLEGWEDNALNRHLSRWLSLASD
ncbi:MAG: peptide ABC transporter substrate-binding protein [Salinicola sp.]|uniref:peptide ABC transporter substrate-binding protein n=1 Tax=Salinicola sp. TaxID=1978524 RepID=UPI001E039916|nr:peptide ABC transporter substrate-binding protein [Salinicola sp.]NRB57080.1 peptide ABC transporter substrate-binding protein [Salinicola sp.]